MRMKRKSVPLRNQGVKTHPAKFAESDRGCRHHNRRGHVRRSQELISVHPGTANQSRGSGDNIPGASFSIWGYM